ncbi:MAG: hypothetical protein PHW63_03770 [Alphaproteobacteria bacterium]|nr:hypothetical protein [Alphaproteobacteria bacterium]
MQCNLCLSDFARLEQSHILPKGGYKRLWDDAEPNPNPYMILGGKAVQTSRQFTAPLFCSSCEQKISANGENWFFRNCVQKNGSFPMVDGALGSSPFVCRDGLSCYATCIMPKLDSRKLAYLGLSVFFRCSLFTFPNKRHPVCQLGNHSEPIRKYLHDGETWPDKIRLLVFLIKSPDIRFVTYFPKSQKMKGCEVHDFLMSGVYYRLMVGERIPDKYKQMCVMQGCHPVFLSNQVEVQLKRLAVKACVESSRFTPSVTVGRF